MTNKSFESEVLPACSELDTPIVGLLHGLLPSQVRLKDSP